MEQQTKHVERFCPRCNASLDEVGMFEVRENVTTWTRWGWSIDRYDLRDEEHGDASAVYVECGKCQGTLTAEMNDAILEELNW